MTTVVEDRIIATYTISKAAAYWKRDDVAEYLADHWELDIADTDDDTRIYELRLDYDRDDFGRSGDYWVMVCKLSGPLYCWTGPHSDSLCADSPEGLFGLDSGAVATDDDRSIIEQLNDVVAYIIAQRSVPTNRKRSGGMLGLTGKHETV